MNESPPDNPFHSRVFSSQNPLAPWHMWGGSVPINYTSGAAPVLNNTAQSAQLAKVNYKRPESWSFFFGATCAGPVNPSVTDSIFITLRVDLILGIGRTVFQTYGNLLGDGNDHFCIFTFAAPPLGAFGPPKWTTTVPAPPMRDGLLPPLPTPQQIDRFCAQDIQAVASMNIDTLPANYALRTEITAFFAPMAHVRPDWFSEGEQFRGDEIGGV